MLVDESLNMSSRPHMKKNAEVFVAAMVSSVMGLISIIAPVFILSLKHYEAPLFPWVASGIENVSLLTVFLLVLSGLALGYKFPKQPFLLGICSMAAFPLLAIIEMLVDSSSHNLFPLEFLYYGVISLIAVVGAYIGRSLHALIHKPD